MAENLNYDTADGTLSWCYRDSPDSCAKFGRLYQWKAAKTACPSGYHLPTNADWDKLVRAVSDYSAGYSYSISGSRLKTKSGWEYFRGYDGSGTDDYGFSALPGGTRIESGNFRHAGSYGFWWTSTEYESDVYYYWEIAYDRSYVENRYNFSYLGYSVRCVK